MKCLICNKRFKINFRKTFDILKKNDIIIEKSEKTSIIVKKGNKEFIITIEIICKECKDDCITKFLDEYYMEIYIDRRAGSSIKKYFIGYYSGDIIRELNIKSSLFSKKKWIAKIGSFSKLILKEFKIKMIF
jgi:hypothetical protein